MGRRRRPLLGLLLRRRPDCVVGEDYSGAASAVAARAAAPIDWCSRGAVAGGFVVLTPVSV